MILRTAKKEDVPELTRISKAAFDTDALVGGTGTGGPPDYDCVSWHEHMRDGGNLYAAIRKKRIVGGAIVFADTRKKTLYIGRIFVDPAHFRQGFGLSIMARIESMFPGFSCKLDTPIWNVRTNRFYTKLGYRKTHTDGETVYYQKELPYETQS